MGWAGGHFGRKVLISPSAEPLPQPDGSGASSADEAAAKRTRPAQLAALGGAVRRRREELSMSLTALEKASGVSKGMLLAIEHGARNAGIVSIFKIADALNVSPAQLIAEAETSSRSLPLRSA
jgi:DNA-binding XRE family transcriptional regulator